MRRVVCAVALLCGLGLLSGHRFLGARNIMGQKAASNSEAGPQPANCENNIAMLEAANHAAGRDGLIIMIARLGNGETKQSLNRRRLHNARFYLTNYLRLRADETIVVAEGESVQGYGRVELYVGGKLYKALAANHNADLIVGSCEPEQLDDARQRELRMKLYPWRDRNLRR